jgi:hypothetical protein
MALLDSEVARIKAELGYPLLDQANAYIGITLLFEQIVQPYLGSGATTTSSTSVTPTSPITPQSITLTSGTGFASLARVVVDVDARQEIVTAQLVSGATLTALFTKTHSGSYPVTVEGGESLVRGKLAELATAHIERGKSKGRGALKEITGDLGWYDTKMTAFASVSQEIATLRDELAALLGVENLWNRKRAAGARLSVY